MKKAETEKLAPKKIIAIRKRKDASGTGLSHYILIEKPAVKGVKTVRP